MKEIENVRLLCTLLSTSTRLVQGSTFGSRSQLEPLIELGFLVPTGHTSVVVCHECDEPHLAEIVQTADGVRGLCMRLGSEFQLEADQTAYSVQPDTVARALSLACGSTDEGRLVPGLIELWSLGSVTHIDRRMMLYFVPRLSTFEQNITVVAAIGSRPTADGAGLLIADPTELPQDALSSKIAILPLRDVVSISSEGELSVDLPDLARRVLPQDLHPTVRPGRPGKKRELAVELIKELDRDGSLRQMSARERHRRLEVVAKARHGKNTTLSRSPCDAAWEEYLAQPDQE